MPQLPIRRLLVLLALVLVVASGCRFASPMGDARPQLKRDLEAAIAGESSDDIVALAEAYVAEEVSPAERVWALLEGLSHASALGDLEACARLVPSLDSALASLDATSTDPADDLLRIGAEAAVRQTHDTAFGRWTGTGSDVARALMSATVALYQRHFDDSPHFAQFLWQRAEFLRRSGARMDAVPIYERILDVDYGGELRERAYTSVIEIWTAESQATPLPAALGEPMAIPSPHAEWIAIAQRRIAEAPGAPDSRRYLIRIAQIQLAYHQKAEGYDTLRRVIAAADDDASVEAASLLLTHLAGSNPSKRQFRTVRKELQGNAHLWSDRGFRHLVKELRGKIEGK